jgi:hypothetical protein
VKTRDFR